MFSSETLSERLSFLEDERNKGITKTDIKRAANELGKITLCWPEIKEPYFEGRRQFPESYYTNNDKERICLLYAENFRRQFSHKYPLRRPILLACENECQIQKMVCTTIRPTTFAYLDLHEWQGCASFVADHIQYDCLENPTLLPPRIISPSSLMIVQHGNSFEMATLLASFLIGQGYNAYVCSGYATQDVTMNIMVRTECPEQLEYIEKEEIVIKEDLKYKLRPPNDLSSQYEKRMLRNKEEAERRAWEREEAKRLAAIAELEKPPFDPLHGWRIHAWVVILPSKRDITEPFFVEPSTGFQHSLDWDQYLGLETIWNHENYWINLQKCAEDLGCLRWDLNNTEHWEHMLVGEPFTTRLFKELPVDFGRDYNMQTAYFEKHLDMPTSWCEIIKLPFEAWERRYCNGSKIIRYKKCIIEYFAPYIHTDGLVKFATLYSDYEYNNAVKVYEFFENRVDCLWRVETDILEEHAIAKFLEGREDCVLEHHYFLNENTCEGRRIIKYNAHARTDGLKCIELTPISMEEEFVDRDDFLIYRFTEFYPNEEKDKKKPKDEHARSVRHVLERYARNETKPAYEDIRVVEYDIEANAIHLKYHYVKGKITYSTRTFIKPPVSERGDKLRFDPEKTTGYNSEELVKPPRKLQLFRLLKKMLETEEKTMRHIQMSDEKIEIFIQMRSLETAMPKLHIDLYHPTRNVKYRQGMLEMEQAEREKTKREIDVSVDYLAPYLARLDNPKTLTKDEAGTIYESCLSDFKHVLMARVLDTQRQFNEVNNELVNKEKWFETIQDSLSRAETEEYFQSSRDKMFLLHCLELRLDRYKEVFPARHEEMEKVLRLDPRLAVLFEK